MAMTGTSNSNRPVAASGRADDAGTKLEASLSKGLAVKKLHDQKASKLREMVDRDPNKVASALRALVQTRN